MLSCLRSLTLASLAVGISLSWSSGAAPEPGHKKHVIITPESITWKANPNLPPGAQAAILSGDPTKTGGLYALRIKIPDGFKVPPHWHPVDENVTVIQGTLLIAVGEKFDPMHLEPVRAGSYMQMAKETRHFAQAKGETIVQLNGIGPFEINYVHPADDPRKSKK